jgi:hypothetical protein
VNATLPIPAAAAQLTSTSLLRRIFSFPVALCSLLAVLSTLTVQSRFQDPDTWWHLKLGEVIWTTHAIPRVDLFSYTTNHHATIPHEWLGQLLIYAAWHWGGYSGLMLWLCFFSAAIPIAGYLLCSLYSGNAKVAFLGAILIWLFSTVGLSIRPQMIGYLLLLVELIVIHLGRTRNPRWFFALPPLFALWINCHGSFFLGMLVMGAFLLSAFFEFQFGGLVAHHWSTLTRRTLMWTMGLSVAALFLNPGGVRQILYPLDAMVNQHVLLASVEEYQPLQFTSARGIAMAAVLGLIVLLAIARRAEIFWDELILLAAGAWLAASHQRLLFVFGILAAPVIVRQLSKSWENYSRANDLPGANAFLIATSIIAIWWAFPSRQNLEQQVEDKSPVKAIEFIHSHHLSGPMLNEFVYGGYLMWAAPEDPVFIDGRADIYDWTGVLAEFGRWATLQDDPNALLNKYGINFCLLTPQSPMARVLPLMSGWKAVYADNNAVIFQRTAPSQSNP